MSVSTHQVVIQTRCTVLAAIRAMIYARITAIENKNWWVYPFQAAEAGSRKRQANSSCYVTVVSYISGTYKAVKEPQEQCFSNMLSKSKPKPSSRFQLLRPHEQCFSTMFDFLTKQGHTCAPATLNARRFLEIAKLHYSPAA